MDILVKMIKNIAVKHAKSFSANVNCYDPRLKIAIIDKIDKNITNLFSSTQVKDLNLNPEYEILENFAFNGFGLNLLDNIIDFLKYGYQAVKMGKFHFNKFLLEYRQELFNNISQQTSRIDLRKGPINADEINNVMKKIFIA